MLETLSIGPVPLPKRRPGPAKPRYSVPRSEWPNIVRRVEQGETLRQVASSYNTSYETVRRTLSGYNRQWNVFIEIKPDDAYAPFHENRYKAQWLANYTRTPVYIFSGQPGEHSSARYSPIQTELKLLSYPASAYNEISYPLHLPENLYLDLLQFYRIGCQLAVETCLHKEMQIGCVWKNAGQYPPPSSINASIEETIKVLHLYDEMKDELQQVLMQDIATFHSSKATNTSLPVRFLLQFVEQPDPTRKREWVGCASCKHVGIYPGDLSHEVDCLVNL